MPQLPVKILSIHIQNFQCRIKVEYSESLNDMLKNIGIKTAFNTKAAQFEKCLIRAMCGLPIQLKHLSVWTKKKRKPQL